ncbi:MAG: hypothetical protein JWP35_128 [Caulobacter sp.]|nr:hypothetical protein [Caulobacter sp.]
MRLALCLSLAVLAPSIGLAAPNDRHPGVYRFDPKASAACDRTARAQPAPARPTRLADLPPAFVIQLQASRTLPQRAPAPGSKLYAINPCLLLIAPGS